MKKLVSSILVIIMILAMSFPAFAAENTSLTITNSAGREYTGYKLLNLTTSLKTGAHHVSHAGEHTSDCYNHAYTIVDKYRAILQEETLANGRNELWVLTGKPTLASGVSDAQILEYLSYQTSDNGDVYMTMRQVADRLYRAIKAASIAADKTGLTGNNDSIEQGYWMFADVTNLTGNASNSLVMVDTKGQDAITINSKTALPTVEIKVKDIEDSEDGDISDNYWHDSADHDITDSIPFKITATLPGNAQFYESYKMLIHGKADAGLTVNNSSFKVYMYNTKHLADVDTDLNDYAKDVTDKFVIKTTGFADDCTFEIICDNLYTIDGVTKDTAFVVSYNAILNESAVIGAVGNNTKVYLEFSNDPYGNGIGKTESDNVKVFTYKLVINKVDSHGHDLEGAGFTLYKKDVLGNYNPLGSELKAANMVQFVWKGLDDGDYKLVESTVPSGYNKMSDIVFSISAEHSEISNDPTLTLLDGGIAMGLGNIDSGTIEKKIENHTGTVLPETGAEGTFLLVCGGSVLVILAAVLMITRKKMSVYED